MLAPANLAIAVGILVAILWITQSHAREKDKRAQEALRRRREREERERRCRWNSPEEIERRRLEAERFRAECEERARQKKIIEEDAAREKWSAYHRYMRTKELDAMTGVQFEKFIRTLFERAGYRSVRDTPASGDQGADLLCESPDGKQTVVQTKRWQGTVGTSAIQEILGALLYYDAELGFVVTNSRFTEGAKALAKKDTRIHLVDKTELSRMIDALCPGETPELDWNRYNQFVKDWRPY